jgi:hypothetical protein
MPRTGIHNRLGNLKQENPMNVNHYIGFDVHKKPYDRPRWVTPADENGSDG